MEKFGLSSFIVYEVPNWFGKGSEDELLDQLFKTLITDQKMSLEMLFKKLAIQMSCKRSIKANHYINELEVKQLLNDLETCQNPYTCPHGRPVVVKLTIKEIEHLFKRTM